MALCDFHLPDMDGLEVPRRLLAAGAMGCVSTARDGSAVVRAVREVAAGHRCLDDALGARVLFETTSFDQLSPRQLEVAMLMVQGRRNTEIALDGLDRVHHPRRAGKSDGLAGSANGYRVSAAGDGLRADPTGRRWRCLPFESLRITATGAAQSPRIGPLRGRCACVTQMQST